MKLHRGRLVDHVHLHAADLNASKRFYSAVLDVLGIEVASDDTHLNADELRLGDVYMKMAWHAGERRS